MDIEEIQKKMSLIDPSINVHYFSSIDSTNSYAYYLGQQGYGNWQIVIADYQTKGQGRLNRKWESIAGKNLLFSILLKPEMDADQIQLLSLFFGEVIRQSLKDYFIRNHEEKLQFKTKWPNDIFLNGKKIAGILIKSAIVKSQFDFIVVGIGVNINQKKSEFPPEIRDIATSVYRETGKEWDRNKIFVQLIKDIYENWKKYQRDLSKILNKWKENTLFVGEKIKIHHFDRIIEGTFVDINQKGHLLVKGDNGKLEIVAGDLLPGSHQ
jgi:BirA family biotin operon repressor/biotin-[acetyl-CoA-carboxylase] ligase